MPCKSSAVVLLSGGLDSTTLLYHVKQTLGYSVLQALTFRYGQKHAREIACAKWQARQAGVQAHRVADLAFFRSWIARASTLTDRRRAVSDLAALKPSELDQPPTYVPHRNLVLLSLAAAYAEAHGLREVFYGAHVEDQYGYWDCTPDFVSRLNAVLAVNRRKPVQIRAPFITLRKAEILAMGRTLGVDYSRTWTCYRGQARPCGSCPTCVERRNAFRQLKIPDPLGQIKNVTKSRCFAPLSMPSRKGRKNTKE